MLEKLDPLAKELPLHNTEDKQEHFQHSSLLIKYSTILSLSLKILVNVNIYIFLSSWIGWFFQYTFIKIYLHCQLKFLKLDMFLPSQCGGPMCLHMFLAKHSIFYSTYQIALIWGYYQTLGILVYKVWFSCLSFFSLNQVSLLRATGCL